MKQFKKIIFLFLGIISLVLAYIGVIMPGIPGIPFVLLAGWFFINSSDKIYNWMLKQRIIGPILKKSQAGNKRSKGVKLFIILQLWISIIVAQIFFPIPFYWMITINIASVIVSVFMYRLLK